MIKFSGADPDGNLVLGLGLSHRNLDLLRQGRPILVGIEEVCQGRVPAKVTIIAGETEAAILANMRRAGAVAPDMQVHEIKDDSHPGP